MIKRFLRFTLFLVLILLTVLLIKTLTFTSKQIKVAVDVSPPLNGDAISHFQKVIQFKTISFSDSNRFDSSQFLGLHAFLESTYPLTHQKLKREVVNKYSVLFYWEGKNLTLKPAILMAHMDVVHVEERDKPLWKVDPFGGILKDSCIWGRGTVDNKINLVSILETTEKLLKEGFQPERSLYLVFGHDEEISGHKGAEEIAKILASRNISVEFVLDEGGFVTTERIPGVRRPVALLGTSEKGFLNLAITVNKEGGHSSIPEKETAIDLLLASLKKLKDNPFEARITKSTKDFMETLGPELPFFQKLILANRWLFNSLIIRFYSNNAATNAMVRTTTVPTILNAGSKENVVPSVATATINIRLLPGDSIKNVTQSIRDIIGDKRVEVSIIGGHEASAATSTESIGYKKVERLSSKTFPNTVITPFLLVGSTDSRYFQNLTNSIIRFSPVLNPKGFHGIDERISLDSYRSALWFYEQLMRDSK